MNGKNKTKGGTNLKTSTLRCRKCDIWVKVIRKGDSSEVNGVDIAIAGPTARKAQKTKDKGRAEFERIAQGQYDVSASLKGGIRKYFLDDPPEQTHDVTPDSVAYAEFVLEPHWVKVALVEDGTDAAVVGADVKLQCSDGELTPKTGNDGIAEALYMREGKCSIEQIVVADETWELVGVE